MNPSRCAALLALFTLAALPLRAEVTIRLVDSVEHAPLEFWAKTVDLPADGGKLQYVIPAQVHVDGRVLPFESYGRGDNVLEGGKAAEESAAVNELVSDLGGGGPQDEPVLSDRANEVAGGMGKRALVKGEFADGEHVVEPGSQRFRVAGKLVAEGDTALARRNNDWLDLVCQPVDVSLKPLPGRRATVVKVSSGGLPVCAASGALTGSLALRLYLPLSAAGYTVEAEGYGTLRLAVEARGVRLLEPPALEPGVVAVATNFTLALFSPPAPRPAAAAAAPAQAELYLFNDRNREVYAEGERVELSLRAWGPAAAAQAALTLADGDRDLALGPVPLRAAGPGAAFAELRLDTALLRPGRYTLRAEAGGTRSNPLPLRVAPALPRSALRLFSHVKWGDASMAPRDMDRLADLGFDFLSDGIDTYHGCNGIQPNIHVFESWDGRVPSEPDRLKEYQKAHFPPELLEGQAATAAGLQQMLARGVGFSAVHFPLILYFNVGTNWADHAEDRYQAGQHLGMLLRRFPNFAGLSYATGDGPTPATIGMVWASAGVASFDVIHDERMKKLREEFERTYGALEVDTSGQQKLFEVTEKDQQDVAQHGGAWGFRVGEEIRMQVTGEADKAVLWGQWVNDLYPANFRRLRADLARLIPEPAMTCGSSWGIGAGGGMYPGTFYRGLDFALNDMHGDWGQCNFNYITGTDILTMGMEDRAPRPWIGLDLVEPRTAANGYKIMLKALSRNPSGVGVLNISQGHWVCAWAADKKRSEALADLMEIPRRLGGLYLNLERRDDIAVLSSFRQEIVGGQPFRALWAAHYLAAKAGYQPVIVTDAYAEKHAAELPGRFKAVFLFGMNKPLSPALRKALADFQAAGGRIIADKASTAVDLPGAIVLPFAVPDSHGPSNENDHLEFERFFLPFIAQFGEALRAGPVTPWFAFESQRKPQHHAINWSGVRSADGDLQAFTVFNDAKPAISNGVAAQFLYEPDSARVTVPTNGVLYDMLRRERVATAPGESGAMSFTCDATHVPGSLYLFADRPIEALEVQAAKQVAPGDLLRLRARALDAAGRAFTGRLPLEVTLRDPAGAERHQVYRTTEQDLDFKIAGNDAPGAWTWSVVDQATGLAADGAFEVAGPARVAAVEPVEDLVYDADAVHDILTNAVEIVLFPEQWELRQPAEALAAALAQRGRRAVVRLVWPADLRDYPMQWFYRTIEDREIRDGVLSGERVGFRARGKNHKGDYRTDNFGSYAYYSHYIGTAPYVYYRNVILLSRADAPSNPLLDTVRRGRMLWRNPSSSFPAPGQGLVGVAFGPFHAGHDAIVVHGRDAEGLQRATAALLRVADAKERPAPQATVALFRAPGPVAPDGSSGAGSAAAAAGSAPPVRSTARRAGSLLRPVYPRAIVEAAADAQGRVLVRQEGDPAAPLAAVAADGQAVRYSLPAGLAPVTVDALAWSLAQPAPGAAWPPVTPIPNGPRFLAALGYGLGAFDAAGAPLWFHDPYPVLSRYEETKYPRRVRTVAVSRDQSRVLVSLYSLIPNQENGFTFNPCAVALLDAATGKPVWTAQSYVGTRLALSADGSRAVVLDLMHPGGGQHNMREHWNPHQATGLSVFDAKGRETAFVPVAGPVDRLAVDRNATLAAISYGDARRVVTLVDLETGRKVDCPYPRIDLGVAVADDGAFAVAAYSDGAVHKLGRDGAPLWKARVDVPGLPAVSPVDGTVSVASPDGRVTFLDAAGAVARAADFAAAPVTALTPALSRPAAPLAAPAPAPFWDPPAKDVEVQALEGAPFAEPTVLTDARTVEVRVPSVAQPKTLLLAFRYQLKKDSDELRVSVAPNAATYRFAYRPQPTLAWVPLRPEAAGAVTLSFAAKGGATLRDGRLVVVSPGDWVNVAATPAPGRPAKFKIGSNPSVPRILVPNVVGLLGDPRREQMSYGLKTADLYACFDHDGLTGTDLYGIDYPMNPVWAPEGMEKDLRSARVLMEFEKPRTIRALGVWDRPGDWPVEAFTLECCDRYETDIMTKELKADWRFVCAGRGNAQYYQLHTFPPVAGRVWRYTLVRTPAAAQRLAELELFEDLLDSGLDLDGPAGDGDLELRD